MSVSGATATVTLASAVAYGETVTVGYTRPGTNPLRDAAGNEVATFSAQAVTNDTPDTTDHDGADPRERCGFSQ